MAEDTPANETPEEQPPVQEPAPEEEQPVQEPAPEEEQAPAEASDGSAADSAEAPPEEATTGAQAPGQASTQDDEDDEDAAEDTPPAAREKPSIPGADLEVDLVLEGPDRPSDPYAYDEDGEPAGESGEEADVVEVEPVTATIDLAAHARYKATGKRKTAVARVILRPGTGVYTVNGKPLDIFFPRATLDRQIRQPLEAVGYEDRMDVVARLHGGGVSAQAGALRHGISKALIDADPNLRGELKRRGFLTRDARVKERKKAGLKKARKRPQFSKR